MGRYSCSQGHHSREGGADGVAQNARRRFGQARAESRAHGEQPRNACVTRRLARPLAQKPEVAEKRRADAEEALAEARAAIDPLEGKTIAQLDELEVRHRAASYAHRFARLVALWRVVVSHTAMLLVAFPPCDHAQEDDEYADSRTLDAYREKRRAELAAAARKRKFGGVRPRWLRARRRRSPRPSPGFMPTNSPSAVRASRVLTPPPPARAASAAQLLPLSRDDFVREVTEASREAPVVLLLFKDSVEGSALLTGILQRVRGAGRGTADAALRRLRSRPPPAWRGEPLARSRRLHCRGGEEAGIAW